MVTEEAGLAGKGEAGGDPSYPPARMSAQSPPGDRKWEAPPLCLLQSSPSAPSTSHMGKLRPRVPQQHREGWGSNHKTTLALFPGSAATAALWTMVGHVPTESSELSGPIQSQQPLSCARLSSELLGSGRGRASSTRPPAPRLLFTVI